jgi:hypothetical protein
MGAIQKTDAPGPALLKIDLGCGPNKHKGAKGDETDWLGLDKIQFDGVDCCVDLSFEYWPFADASVGEAHSSHFIEHLTAAQRCYFFNELWRVLVPGGKATIITPHWSSCRAYGDPTHQWPPIGEMFFYYLNQKWRDENAPHADVKKWPQGYACDFDASWGYNAHPLIAQRNSETQQFAIQFYKEAVQDLHATVTKR